MRWWSFYGHSEEHKWREENELILNSKYIQNLLGGLKHTFLLNQRLSIKIFFFFCQLD